MILFILDTKKKKTIIKYILASIICVLINFIYSIFGHGVTSNFMTYMFAYPLILGILFTLINNKNSKLKSNLFLCGISTLTVGSFIQGILEIAGTASDLIYVYYVVGVIFIITGIIYMNKENI